MNKIIIGGRIVNDLEPRSTEDGKHFLNFRIAINEGSKEKQITNFFNVNAWNNVADFISKYFIKGRKILLEGSLKTSQYEKDGNKLTNTYILVHSAEFMDSKKEEKEEEFTQPDKVVFEDDDLPF